MPNRQQRLFNAANKLARYYGLKTQQDLAAVIALEEVRSPGGTGAVSESATTPNLSAGNPNSAEAKLIALIIDTSTGALLTKDILDQIHNTLLSGTPSRELIAELGSLLQICYSGGDGRYGGPGNFAVSEAEGDGRNRHITDVQQDVGVRELLNNEEHPFINQNPTNPSKNQPGLAAILSNSTRVSPLARFVNPVTLFLNSIPNLEISRAVPYVNIEFFVDRPPIADGNRLQALSLPKFLLGAAGVGEDGILRGMAQANRVYRADLGPITESEEGEDPNREFTRGGMELMTAPQTMVNADQFETNNAIRANPVLDKFRPLLSLKEVKINVVPSTGIMSFKTATVSMVLHDRSRMHEIAEFIRPDFYSRNEITIEYGWSHPDGEKEISSNVYGDLINGMRVKEKFMIRNSSFSFDDSGQVNINLDLAMRGASDFDTLLISSNSETFNNTIREIRELEETIADLRARVYPEGTGARSSEIRGVMVLDAAADARNHLTFTNEFRTELTALRRSLGRSEGRPDVSALLNAITRLYGTEISTRSEGTGTNRASVRSGGEGSLTTTLRRSIQQDVEEKITNLNRTPEADPFLLPGSSGPGNSRRTVTDARDAEERRRRTEFNRQQFGANVEANNPVSLGKLLLYFIGEPLAASQRYDDVQLIFYPFNIKAGRANRMNIANFLVDLDFFADEFVRYRLNHVGRDGTMTLRQFMQFVQDTLIDDHGARSYGISELFETVVSEDGTSLDTRARYEAPEYMQRLEQILNGVTPNGEFTMPVIDFYVEALPQNVRISNPDAAEDSSSDKTILRIHIFDRTASSYESLGSLLRASRNAQITALGNGLREVPEEDVNEGVDASHRQQWQNAITEARQQGLIEFVTPGGTTTEELGPDVTVRFIGGTGQSLKNFLMSSMPYIIYGSAGTGLISANLSSMQDSALSTVNMLRSFRRRGQVLPNGEQPGGLPMQIIPTQLSVETYGCPLISFAQQFFIDFQTGTTADNIYGVAGMEHNFSPGEYKSSIRFVPMDAFGTYNSLLGRINTASTILNQIRTEGEGADASSTGTAPESATAPTRSTTRSTRGRRGGGTTGT